MDNYELYVRAKRIWDEDGSKKGFSVSEIEEFIVEWEAIQKRFGVCLN